MQEETHKSLRAQLAGRIGQIKERMYERYEVDLEAELDYERVVCDELAAKNEIREVLMTVCKTWFCKPLCNGRL